MPKAAKFDIETLRSMYARKKVLVTGHTGFKGSWLSLWLTMLGAEVMGYSLPPKTEQDHCCLLKLPTLVHHIEGDVRDFQTLKNVCDEFQPEYVFHLAAQPLVRLSYADPKTTFDTNIGGTVNILEIARQSSYIRSLVCITSDKCYRNKEWIWGYRENDELGGPDPYSASKAAAELIYQAYLESFFSRLQDVGVATVRAGNVIGGGDWSVDRIIPDCIRALHDNRPIVLRNPHATRPWQHVLEPLSGYLLLGVMLYNNPKLYTGSWNFGPSEGAVHTVEELSAGIIRYWGQGEIQIVKDENAFHEAGLLHLNCDKAHHILGWHPRWDFEQTIKHTTDWYKQLLSGIPAAELTKRQIEEYMEGTS